jgi:outer membrane protein assembly factor BamB
MSERRISTVLMLDVVGSTHVAADLGDARYRELSRRFDQVVRSSLRRFGGKEEDHAGDGFFATFAQPDRAIRCAAGIADEVRELGIEIRGGIHTGQTQTQAGKAQGIAVVIGARVMSLAGAGEILVTSTTKELVTGSAFGFEDLSAHELKGVPGTWQVFVVTTVDGDELAGPLGAAEAAERRTAIEPSTDRQRPRPAVWIAVAAVALATILGLVFVAGRDAGTPPSADQGPDLPPSAAVVQLDPERAGAIVRSVGIPTERHGVIPLPNSAHPIAVGQGGVWTVRWRSVFHVDPSRSEVRTRITIQGGTSSFSTNLAVGLDEVWLADGGLLEIDPATDEQRRVVSLGSPANPVAAADVAVGGGFVWMGLGDGRLIRFDPRTGRHDARTGLDPIDAIAFGDGAVWTVDVFGGTVSAYDPETMRPRAEIPSGGADAIVVGNTGVWVLSRSVGTLSRIEPSTLDVSSVVQVGPTPTGVAAGSGAIWVGDKDGMVRRVDEDTRQVTGIPFGAEIRALAFDDDDDTLWIDVA